jgi:hypothetical protein
MEPRAWKLPPDGNIETTSRLASSIAWPSLYRGRFRMNNQSQ